MVSNLTAAMDPILLSVSNILKLAGQASRYMFVPSTYESEAGGLRVQGQFGLHCKTLSTKLTKYINKLLSINKFIYGMNFT